MNVQVRFGAGLVSAVGASRQAVSLAEGATVADLVEHLQFQHPALASQLGRAVPVIAGRHVSPAEGLSETQEVALLLPVAGG